VKIEVSHGHLEANLRPAEGEAVAAAVVCHPHPLHGGTMHTKAVFRTAQALNEAGIHALRFNFRGGGTSTGSYDEGRGEEDDARAALAWLAARYSALPLVLAGFSFGSRVGLRVGAGDERVKALVGLGVAADLFDFSFLDGLPKPLLVLQGEHDEFGAPEEVRKLLEPRVPELTLVEIPGADHYFHGRFDELKNEIRGYFLQGPGARVLQQGAAGAGEPSGSEPSGSWKPSGSSSPSTRPGSDS